MTSAPSRLQRLSGNKVILAFLCFVCWQKIYAQDSLLNRQKELVIALLLPFQSEDVYQLENGKFHFGEESQLSVEYFQGASLAVDSLNKAGIHCRLLVFDAG